jgi:protein ImuB
MLGEELSLQPFVLQARDPRRGLRVMAADPLARQMGIAPGMSVSEASALVPSLRLLEYDAQEDLQSIVELAEEAWQFSPLVGLESLDEQLWAGRSLHQPQALFFDVTGLIDYFGGEAKLLSLINQWLTEKKYVGITALAPSVGAAWAITNYAYRQQATIRLLAMRAVSSAEEPAEAIPTTIDFKRLPIEALRLDIKTAHSLRQLGVRTVEALSRLPRAGLANRLGERLLNRLDAVLEGQTEPIRCLKEKVAYSVEQTLEIPTNHRETIEELLRRLSIKLCDQLQRHGHGVIRLVCCLRVEQAPAVIVSLGLFRATADREHLFPLLLGAVLQKYAAGAKQSNHRKNITAITLNAMLTGPLVWKQTELFECEANRHRESLARFVDSLSGRLGRRQVVAAQIQRHPQPELVCQWRPLTGQRTDGLKQSTQRKLPRVSSVEPSCHDPLRRPLQLWQPPVPIEVKASQDNGLPSCFFFDGQTHRIVQSCGPERIESGWWQGANHRRDYYRIETDRGAWLWIYRDLKLRTWFLHGVF